MGAPRGLGDFWIEIVMPETIILMPAYNQFRYTRATLGSLIANTVAPFSVLLVDDCSDDKTATIENRSWMKIIKHPEREGITASWNSGMREIQDHDIEAICIVNNDVLFGPLWLTFLLEGLRKGYSFVGPISNQPGGTGPQGRRQRATSYLPDYQWNDSSASIVTTSIKLQRNPKIIDVISPYFLNGFCFAGLIETFHENRWDENHIFNPDPKLKHLGSDDEFFQRYQNNWPSVPMGICTGSFVFHYKGVSYEEFFGTRGMSSVRMDGGESFFHFPLPD